MNNSAGVEMGIPEAIAAKARAFVVRLADPDLNIEAQTAFDEWLAADVRHERAYLRALRAYDAAGVLRGMLTKIPEVRKASPHRSWTAAGLTALAACVLVYLLPKPVARAPDRFVTATAEQKTIHLVDGSSVNLDSQTVLEVSYTNDHRMVRLGQGAAYFSVERDESRPFIITLADSSVEVLGTDFEVKSVCGAVRVSVADGVVRFHRQRDAVEIRAGQRVELGSDGAFSTPRPARQIAAWRSGTLSYNNATICEVVSDANRQGGEVIKLSDPALASLRITASYPTGQRPAMLASLEAALPIRVEHHNNNDVWLLPTGR
jgi:transmembrane sensor